MTSPETTPSPSSEVRADLVARTVELALLNVEEGGKPFACVVVDGGGEVVVEATNQVAQTGDVTAHAEVMALRELANRGISDLEGYEMYVTAYPCPMCLGALYYAAPDRVVFAATREQEAEHYEDGGRYMTLTSFYDEYAKEPADRALPTAQGPSEDPAASFKAYAERHGS